MQTLTEQALTRTPTRAEFLAALAAADQAEKEWRDYLDRLGRGEHYDGEALDRDRACREARTHLLDLIERLPE